MIPRARFTKTDGSTGVTVPSAEGICVIIAPSSTGVANQPQSHAKPSNIVSSFGGGVLVEYGAHMIDVTGKPVILIKADASTAAAYGAVALEGAGTSVPSAGAATPLDDYAAQIDIVTGGTIGVAGITYTESLDGGVTKSAIKALGTATSITIPASGVQVALAAGTLIAGDTITAQTTGPRLTTADLATALEALRVSSLPWEIVLVGGHDATATTVSMLDLWLAAREAEGKYRGFVINARPRNVGESEAAYATAMTTAFATAASIRGCVCADGGNVVSSVPGRGIALMRPTALALAARLMSIPYGTDPSYVNDGPIAGGFTLSDEQGNPLFHDETAYPGLDDLRLVTLRTFEGRNGTFITNANVIAPAGSDFVWAQHFRTMNRACALAFAAVTGELSRGVHKNPTPGPAGARYIAEEDALAIEDIANAALNELRGQVTDLRFSLSRTDDIGSNGPAVLTGDVEIAALSYVKEFSVNARFVRSITVQ